MKSNSADCRFPVLLSLVLGLSFLIYLPLAARTLYLSPEGDDDAPCAAGSVFRTLSRAAGCLASGDTLLVREGTYAGGVYILVKATPEAPILIRGESLSAVVSGSGAELDAIRIQDASYITLDRLTVLKANRAGCAVRFSNHVTITNCNIGDNATWGIFTSFSDDLRFEGNECYGSHEQHGIYHSNSGDRFIIRGNRVHDNSGNGIHLNGDPEMVQPGSDGVLNWGVVERNIIWGNGQSGGAGINMTHVHDILVRNNLIYKNYAAGMTIYQDTGTFEQGSKRVAVLGNTVYFAKGYGRACINIQPTTEKVLVAGNIFVCGDNQRGAIEVESDHLPTIISDRNILWGADSSRIIERKDNLLSIQSWRSLSGNDLHSILADPQFADIPGADYRLRDTSPAVDAAMPLDSVKAVLERLGGFEWILAKLDSLPYEDFLQHRRPAGGGPDIGACESGTEPEKLYDFNGDGRLGLSDVLSLILLARRDPAAGRLDVDADGRYSAADVLRLLLIICGRVKIL